MCPDPISYVDWKKKGGTLVACLSCVQSDYAVFPARQPCYYLAAGM